MVFCKVTYFRKMHCFDIFIFPLPNALLKFSVWRAQWHLKHCVRDNQESFVTVRGRQLRWLSTRSTLREAWPMKLTIQHFFQIWAAGSEHLNQIWTTRPAAEMLSPPPAVWTAWGSSRISFYTFECLALYICTCEQTRTGAMQISMSRLSSVQQVSGLELMNGTLVAPSWPLVAKLSSMIRKLFSGRTWVRECDSWQLYLFVNTSSYWALPFASSPINVEIASS